VFPQKFFPGSDPFVATMLSFTTFFVGFVARPIGAAIFGHFGDRVGRKKLLVFTMIVMGASTMAVGLTPSYDVIGVWGAVFLTLGRILQGLAIGGQWSGSVLMAAEWTDPKRRGFTTSFAQLGAPAGMVLANGALALMTGLTTNQQFLEWGWRIPFLASVALVIAGFYIRSGVHETPVFEDLKKAGGVVKAPLVEVLRNNGKEVALTALMRTSQQVCFYIYTTYVITYATTVLGFGRGVVLNMVMTMAVVSCLANPLFGHLSDLYGRRTITAIGCALMIVFPFIYFGLLDTRSLPLVFLAIVLSNPIQDIQYGPQAAFIAESFSRLCQVQRLGARVSARIDHRRWPGAADRDVSAPRVRVVNRDRRVHRALFRVESDLCIPAEGAPRRAGSPVGAAFRRPTRAG
jgi:MFS family permease